MTLPVFLAAAVFAAAAAAAHVWHGSGTRSAYVAAGGTNLCVRACV